MSLSIVLSFDAAAYSVLAVQKACHRFSNLAAFEVQTKPAEIVVSATLLDANAEQSHVDYLSGQLRNEALEQTLRESVRQQTEGTRHLILAHAFSRTGLISEVNVDASAEVAPTAVDRPLA
ncbi:MAG: hypothetical protein ACLGGW_10820 [Gammaproteobacteria bacterium]